MKIVSGGILFLSLMLLGLGGITTSCQAQGVFSNPTIGKKAPDLKLEMSAGGEQSLRSIIEGKKAILVFWATWCPHCRSQLDVLAEERKEIEALGIVIQPINIGEDKAKVARFLKDKGYDFNVMLDVDSLGAETYQVMGIPTLVFIGAEGNIRAVEYELMEDFERILQ